MNENQRYKVNRPMVIDELFEDEYVIVNLESGSYYGVAHTGKVIWSMVASGMTCSEISSELAGHYDTDRETIDNAVRAFLTELEREALIVHNGSADAHAESRVTGQAAVPNGERSPFLLPELEKYTDMQQVLQLDPIHEVDESGWPHAKAN
jgi:hypothetical protein